MTDTATDKPAGEQEPAMVSGPPARDISQIEITEWDRREVPAVVVGGAGGSKRESRCQVVIRQSVLNQIHRHGLASQEIEVCGVRVGMVYHDDVGPWVYVECAIEGNHATGRAAQVTFTAETWTHIQDVMERDHRDKRILGWYHTHPGFGIFLSDMDVFIQENFFPEPWQVALVYDPKGKEEGVFLWKQGKPETDPLLLEADAPVEEQTTVVSKAKTVGGAAPAGGGGGGMGAMIGDVAQFVDRLEVLEKRQKMFIVVLCAFALVAVVWPLVVAAFLPDLMRREKPPAPPINLPSDDPTSRPLKL
jgi:proteasome lid subunit RPN8/RPN11